VEISEKHEKKVLAVLFLISDSYSFGFLREAYAPAGS
jgi:hypothetical protein